MHEIKTLTKNSKQTPMMIMNATVAATNMFNPKKQNKLDPLENQLLLQPAHKLSKQIKDGSLSSLKLCEAYIERIKHVQPMINAVAQERFQEALEEAKALDQLLADFRSGKPESDFQPEQLEKLKSPLFGVPISVKESIMVKGMKNSCGLVNRKNVVATEDAVPPGNARRFGMVVVCTTNIPVGTLYWADCSNKVYGRSNNPYDLSRITGASSGGEGALIASGGSLIGIGSDIAGSLRIPAQFCGIYSHKCSPHLCSAIGNYPPVRESRLRLFTIGPMSRYASDLRPLLRCLISDKNNANQESQKLKNEVLQSLDEPVDLSGVKFCWFDFRKSKLKGKHALNVLPEINDAQQEVLNHFKSKFNCQVEQIDLDDHLRRSLITWQCMMRGGGLPDRDQEYDEKELEKTLGIENIFAEFIKLPFGLSNHTKEALLTVVSSINIPTDPKKAFPICEKYEAVAAEMKANIEAQIGSKGVLVLPTLPTLAYKHNAALLKTMDLRFPALFNVLQFPVTHATIRLDKKHRLPYGLSFGTMCGNDALTIAIAEEIEATFGGWTQPTLTTEVKEEKSKPVVLSGADQTNQVASATVSA